MLGFLPRCWEYPGIFFFPLKPVFVDSQSDLRALQDFSSIMKAFKKFVCILLNTLYALIQFVGETVCRTKSHVGILKHLELSEWFKTGDKEV